MKLRKCQDCEWMFFSSRIDAVRCNECGGAKHQPRVCKVGGKETSWATLLKLAKYTMPFVHGARLSLASFAEDAISDDIDAELAAAPEAD